MNCIGSGFDFALILLVFIWIVGSWNWKNWFELVVVIAVFFWDPYKEDKGILDRKKRERKYMSNKNITERVSHILLSNKVSGN